MAQNVSKMVGILVQVLVMNVHVHTNFSRGIAIVDLL